MTILKIEIGRDNPILRAKSQKVLKFDKKLKKFAQKMTATMFAADGVGLAAPQVGVNEQIVILNFQISAKDSRPITLINPEIIDASTKLDEAEEGCLSLPKEFASVIRHVGVTVRFADESGAPRILELDGLNARAIQHEIDHLNGILFIDRAEGRIQHTTIKSPQKTF